MYTPNDKTLLQLGLYDYVWGDNSMLQNYLSRVEAEKNRNEQRAYNDYLKEYDRAKAESEEAARKRQELKDAEVELASLNRDLINAKPTEAAIIRKRQEALLSKFPQLMQDDSVEKAYEDEQKFKKAKLAAQQAIPATFDTDADIAKAIAAIAANSELLDSDKEELIKAVQSKKSTATLAKEASQSAYAANAGGKTTKKLDWNDVKDRAKQAGYVPTSADKAIAKQNGHHWDKKLQTYVK